MGDWTIQYNGVEQTLDAWGIEDCIRTRQSQTITQVKLMVGGRALDASELFTYGSTVIIWQNRELIDGVWSGGQRWFYGRVEPWDRAGEENAEGHFGALVCPWWYLTQIIYEWKWKLWSGWTGSGIDQQPVFATSTSTHVILNLTTDFANHPDGKLTIGEQIIDALQWAISKGAPFQIGDVTPDFDVPIDEDKNLTCEGVIQKQLSWCPDAFTEWDMTTLPYPTMNIRRLGDLADLGRVANIDVNRGRPTNKLRIKTRPDWQRPFVRLIFEQEVNGFLETIEDIWPNPIPAATFGGLVSTVTLMGWNFASQQATLVCDAINESSSDWWANGRSAEVKEAASVVIYPATAKRESLDGNPVNGAFTNELIDGSIAPWMRGIAGQRIRISVQADVTLKDGTVRKNRTLTHDPQATNATSGNYSDRQITQIGDPIPFGLARQMWESFQGLAAEGELTEIDDEISATFSQWTVLNFLSDAQPDWVSLECLPQQITDSLKMGTTTVQFGAPSHLNPNQLVSLLRIMRTRFIVTGWDTPSSGQIPQQAINGGNNLPRKLSQAAVGNYQTHVVSDDVDGQGVAIMSQADDEAGDCSTLWASNLSPADPDYVPGSVKLSLAEALGRDVALRWFYFKNADDNCNRYRILVPCSAPELAPPGT